MTKAEFKKYLFSMEEDEPKEEEKKEEDNADEAKDKAEGEAQQEVNKEAPKAEDQKEEGGRSLKAHYQYQGYSGAPQNQGTVRRVCGGAGTRQKGDVRGGVQPL